MQGESSPQRDVLDVESLAGHLLPAGGVFRFLAEHRQRLFPDVLFADLFPSGRGRPSIPGEVIASVIVLQSLHGLTDREAVDALTFDLRWKAACGYPVDKKGFDASSLTVWRARLASSQRPQRIFEVVRDVIAATGAVKGRQRRALDSTILDDAVARQDTVTQLIAQVRRVGREVPGAQQIITERCTRLEALTGQGYDLTAKPRIAWDDIQVREELVTALVNDALALLDGLDTEAITSAGGKPAEAIALLALVAGQDVEPAEGSDGTDGRWRIAHKVAPERVISTVDPEARHAHKTVERRQDGFKAHVVIEPDTGLATMVERTTRLVLLVKLPHPNPATAAHVLQAFSDKLNGVASPMRQSLTYDRGREMAEHARLTQNTGMRVYFCDPYSPWQRGSNENTNGLLRQYFPKGTDLSGYTQEQLDAVADELNGRPRMTLGYSTPLEVYAQHLHRLSQQPESVH